MADLDIIGPFEGHPSRTIKRYRIRNGDTRHQRHLRRDDRRNGRPQNNGCINIGARRGLPGPAQPAFSPSLAIRNHHGSFGCTLMRQPEGDIICRIHRFKVMNGMPNFPAGQTFLQG